MSPRLGIAGSARWAALLLLATALSSLACEQGDVPDGRRYEVSGIVRGIERDGTTTRLRIEHEAIPAFTDIDGEEVGMEAMTMSMAVWHGTILPPLDEGDAVQFVLDVDWTRTPSGLIVDVKVLDPVDSAPSAGEP